MLKPMICAVVTPLFFVGCTQAPTRDTSPAPAGSAASAPAPRSHGKLAQVMRGILFPNSNVIFYVQDKDPTKVKPAADPALSTDPLAGAYAGWTAVENSALALAESA